MPSRQRKNANGPRHTTADSHVGAPSTVGCRPAPGQNQALAGLRASRRARQAAYIAPAAAIGQAQPRGISEASTENAADAPNSRIAPIAQREGRHSSRQLTDPVDERGDFGIFGKLMAHEPVPELIVLAIEQL